MHFKKLSKLVIFCVAILILRMVMLYYFKRGKNATEMQKKICAVYGGVLTDGMCQKRFVKLAMLIERCSTVG